MRVRTCRSLASWSFVVISATVERAGASALMNKVDAIIEDGESLASSTLSSKESTTNKPPRSAACNRTLKLDWLSKSALPIISSWSSSTTNKWLSSSPSPATREKVRESSISKSSAFNNATKDIGSLFSIKANGCIDKSNGASFRLGTDSSNARSSIWPLEANALRRMLYVAWSSWSGKKLIRSWSWSMVNRWLSEEPAPEAKASSLRTRPSELEEIVATLLNGVKPSDSRSLLNEIVGTKEKANSRS